MNLHRTTATLDCGCRVHFIWDADEPVETRMHEPVREDCQRLPWTIEPHARVRKGCAAHWHEDHHEHFRRILVDANKEAPHQIEHVPGVGIRHRLEPKT